MPSYYNVEKMIKNNLRAPLVLIKDFPQKNKLTVMTSEAFPSVGLLKHLNNNTL